MHELSIAESLLSTVLETLDAEAAADSCVEEVVLRVGWLAGVEKESLRFCYDVVTAGSPLEGSRLVIEEVPVAVFCPACQAEAELPAVPCCSCPRCGTPCPDVRRGRELELVEIRLAEDTQ